MKSGIIVINKSTGYTSRDIVNILSHELHTKKIGHTGTLDPIATGVLVICIGESTKICELLTAEYKEYIATIKLGIKTDTLDITGKILEQKDFNIDLENLKKTLSSFKGHSKQQVPLYSAIKINGKKLYEYARQNIKVELPYRDIDIKNIELISFKDDLITFKTTVSKGTYIRSLINDICTKLGTIGTMQSLIRTKQGKFSLDESFTIEDIKNNHYNIISIEETLSSLETINIDEELYIKIKNGAIIDKTFKNDIACIKYQDKIIAIYKTYSKDNTKAKPFKMFIGEE